MFTVKIHFAKVCGIVIYSVLDVVPYSLNILRGKIFADFAVLSVISKKFTLEIFRSPYSLIHFGSVCKSAKIFSNIAQSRNI